MYRTSDGGHSYTTFSPVCGTYTGADCDPVARFIAPLASDVHDSNHWVVGGSAVWDTVKGWGTSCAGATCDFTRAHDLGLDAAGGHNQSTAIAVSGVTTYAGWIGGGGNPGPAYASGIDTNYGGTWRRIAAPNLPQRYVAGLTVDPAAPAHVYAVYNGYSRRWIPGGGQGVVFESRDGGSTWADISGNLPDTPGDALAVVAGQLVLGTDTGLFTASASTPTRWAHVTGVPNVSVNNVTTSPDGRAAVVATHGRGIWAVTPADAGGQPAHPTSDRTRRSHLGGADESVRGRPTGHPDRSDRSSAADRVDTPASGSRCRWPRVSRGPGFQPAPGLRGPRLTRTGLARPASRPTEPAPRRRTPQQ